MRKRIEVCEYPDRAEAAPEKKISPGFHSVRDTNVPPHRSGTAKERPTCYRRCDNIAKQRLLHGGQRIAADICQAHEHRHE
jgi:hypothetical protein